MFLLASNSPRRKQLLALTGWKFTIRPAEVDEDPLPEELPLDYVLRLAKAKAFASASWAGPNEFVVAADTTVVDGSEILGKPLNATQAEEMLRNLQGRIHQVFTALAVYDHEKKQTHIDWCRTDVSMRRYSDDEITNYIKSGDPMDKAGAYAIQHRDFHPVETLDGCYANVVGLPLCHLVRTLRRFAIEPIRDVPAECQSALEFDCPVYKRVLDGEI